MRRADRLLRTIQILRRHRRPVTGQLMSEELEVSLRTIYRDIADLIADGVPIRGEAGVGYVLAEGYDLPPLMFNTDELEAVMLGLRWVMRRGDKVLRRGAQDAVAKVGAVLPKDKKSELFDAALFVPPAWLLFQDSVDLAVVRRAIREQHKIEISYTAEDGKGSQRVVWPLAIAYLDAQRLMICWCELRSDFRSFRTDRIGSNRVLDERYTERRKSLLKRWMQQETAADRANQADVFM